MWIFVPAAIGCLTLAWLVMRWRPNLKRLQRRNPEKAAELAQQLLDQQRFGTRDGLPPSDPLASSAHQAVRFGGPGTYSNGS